MTTISLHEHLLTENRKLSEEGVCHFLRLGFLPSPLSVEDGKLVINDYEGLFKEHLSLDPPHFHRNLSQFTGSRDLPENPPASPDLQEFERILLNSVKRDTAGASQVYLMASGGKDSLSIAWALHELGISTTLIHCTNRGREDESAEVTALANRLGQECLILSDDIESVDTFFRANAVRQSIPNADAAFFAYVRAISTISKRSEGIGPDESIALLDGMGNDAYMGHIPGSREKRLVRLPRLKGLTNRIAMAAHRNDLVHYAFATLFKPRYERAFSGAGFCTWRGAISEDLEKIFRKGNQQPELRRARIRGGVFDLDCCIRKGVTAAQMEPRIKLSYPYLAPELISFFQKLRPAQMFDYDTSLNKKVLRSFLKKRGITSEYVEKKKGSFRFNLDGLSTVYSPSPGLASLVSSLGISARHLESLRAAAPSHFVAAQKLGFLYSLDVFISSHNLDFETVSRPVQITYTT